MKEMTTFNKIESTQFTKDPWDMDIKEVSISETKPKDRNNGYPITVPKWYTKLNEKIPGVITWFLLLLPIICSLLGYPEVVIVYVSFLTIYWSYRGVVFVYGLILAYVRMKRDLSTDWVAEIEKLNKKDLKYLYICPFVNEGMDVLEPTIEAFSKQDIGPEKITVIFALEEKYKDSAIPKCDLLKRKYGKYFNEMSYIVHPFGIEGEVVGVKGANINWATRHFVKLLEARGEDLEDYLLFTCDSDLRPHPKLFSAITYKYHTVEKPLRTFFASAIHTFQNNVWRVPPLNRVFAQSLTLVTAHNWTIQKGMRDTWSAYFVNLKTVDEAGYWDPEISNDDTYFYWNSIVRFNGDFKGEEVYIPTYNDAVENETFIKSHKSLYKQQHRWGWGIIVFPITMAGFYKNNGISFLKKLSLFVKLYHNQLFYLTVIYILTLSTPIMNILSPEFQYSSASYNLARIMSYILTSLMFLNIPIYIIRRKIVPIPKDWSIWRKIYDFFEIALITVNMLTFGFIPHVQAQTEMLLNMFSKKYYITDKVKMREKPIS